MVGSRAFSVSTLEARVVSGQPGPHSKRAVQDQTGRTVPPGGHGTCPLMEAQHSVLGMWQMWSSGGFVLGSTSAQSWHHAAHTV